MASYTTRPNRQGLDLDPYEQFQNVLDNPKFKPYLLPGIEMPDLLTLDIEEQLVAQCKMAQFPKGWLDTKKEEANEIMDQLKIDKEKYEIWIGHQSWAQDEWAAVELRIKKSNRAVQVSSALVSNDLDEIIKQLYECAKKELTVKPNEESENKKVLLLVESLNHFGGDCSFRRAVLVAYCSIADERFAKLFTIIRRWKEREFDKIDTKGAFSLYAFALMLIHFLQVGCQPPVLPPAYDLGLVYFKAGTRYFSARDIKFKSENKKSLGNLLFNFFDYFETTPNGGFDFENWKISVSEGEAMILERPSKTFFIEDPFYVASVNVVDESKSPGISIALTVMFMKCRALLMKDRRLENIILA